MATFTQLASGNRRVQVRRTRTDIWWEAFRHRLSPAEAIHDGVGVMEMLMGLYRSAELGQRYISPTPNSNMRSQHVIR